MLKSKPIVRECPKIIIKPNGPVKKSYRYRPRTIPLREIRKLQKIPELCIPFQPPNEIIRKIAYQMCLFSSGIRFQRDAIIAIKEITCAHLVRVFEDYNIWTILARVTVTKKNIELARRIRGKTLE